MGLAWAKTAMCAVALLAVSVGKRSIGKKFTEEYAVMVDPFRPLKITEEAMKVEDKSYATSWLDTEENYLHDRSQE